VRQNEHSYLTMEFASLTVVLALEKEEAKEEVFNIAGPTTGAAMAGLRPVTEIMFCDFLPLAGDQIINQAAKMRYMFGGQVRVPLWLQY